MPTIADADANAARLGRSPDVIPRGPYCYRPAGAGRAVDASPALRITPCPYWAADPSRPADARGYCAFLGLGDWMEDGTLLLFDQVKECGVRLEDEDEPASEPSQA